MLDFITREHPTAAFIQFDSKDPVAATRQGDRFRTADAEITLARAADSAVDITLRCPVKPVQRIVLRWKHPAALPATALFLADHWERSYGDLQWRSIQP